ncbi:MAG: hypothetical protein GX595_15155 [Lentisphaerae bacterium]|nr:hypothetical protein [Lentisphaerota bacterium]
MSTDSIRLQAGTYQQFDADYSLPVPGEGYGGWRQAEIAISAEHTALVVMHAWDCGDMGEHPGIWRSVEYIPRSYQIAREVFPPLLDAVRRAGLAMFHVVGGGDYYKGLPGYRHACDLAGAPPAPPATVPGDPHLDALRRFRADHVWRGAHNRVDEPGFRARLDFLPQARPIAGEGIAENSPQLLALCCERGINHLIYVGFAIDACLLSSPGGMIDMSRHGVMCSTVRQAVTAVENRETARRELAKEIGLWRVAVSFGFVFDDQVLIQALNERAASRAR